MSTITSEAIKPKLQWSHVLTNVETTFCALCRKASTSLQWSHVLTNVETGLEIDCGRTNGGCFNGATSSRTWKHHTEALHSFADQGFNGATSSRTWKLFLRWKTLGPMGASMEPRPHERGNHLPIDELFQVLLIASMEPRPHERGNTEGPSDPQRLHRLQWSHVLTNVETRTATLLKRLPFLLQWSHVLTNVETRSGWMIHPAWLPLQWSHVLTNVETKSTIVPINPETGFNGATSSRTWKLACGCVVTRSAPGFNGATSSRTWKLVAKKDGQHVQNGFNGATSSRTWKPPKEQLKEALELVLQWSHVLTNVETSSARSFAKMFNCSFNGATSSRTWKHQRADDADCSGRLQWSHVLTNVETCRI